MENQRTLFERYLNGECNSEELQQLLSYFEMEGEEIPELQNRIRMLLEEGDTNENLEYIPLLLERNAAKLAGIVHKEENDKEAPSVVRRMWRLGVVAAVLLCVLGGVIYLQMNPLKDDTIVRNLVDITPGTDRALLILDGKREYELDGKSSGIINKDDAVRYTDGTLLTSLQDAERLILRTPKGGQFNVTLPDGTKAWLNADSEISYPAVFDAKERKLVIRGEVYLQVAKEQDRPFVVACKDQKIEVLGTHFNVNAYRDKGEVMTTLSEGSVRITHSGTGEVLVLKPGEQVQVATRGKMKVRKVDLDEVLSWKDGLYIIHDQELGLFGRQLERWYNVDINMTTFEKKRLSAVIPRNATLTSVLDAITLKTGVQFDIQERRVTAVKK